MCSFDRELAKSLTVADPGERPGALQKNFFGDRPPLLRVWVTPPPLSVGLDPPLINMYFFTSWCDAEPVLLTQ